MSELDALLTLLIVIGLLLPVVVGSCVAGLYIIHVYLDEQGWTNPLFRDLVRLDLVCIGVGVALLAPALVAVLGLPRLPFTGAGVALGVVLLLIPPIIHAQRFYRLRKGGQAAKTASTLPPEEENTDGANEPRPPDAG